MVLAVSHLLSSLWGSDRKSETELIPKSLNVSDSQTEILKTGIYSYLLPGQEALGGDDISALSFAPAFEKYVSQEILKVHTEPLTLHFLCKNCSIVLIHISHCGFSQACREKHIAVEGFMVYCVLWEGITECSNTLEDADDTELLPQALVFKPCRKHTYGLLLLNGHDGNMRYQSERSHNDKF